jgi:hypothetical protein
MKPASFCIKSHQTLERTSNRWRYERMPIEKKTEKVDRPVSSTSSTGGKKRRPTRRSNSHFRVNSFNTLNYCIYFVNSFGKRFYFFFKTLGGYFRNLVTSKRRSLDASIHFDSKN